jgi:hypothetical protein
MARAGDRSIVDRSPTACGRRVADVVEPVDIGPRRLFAGERSVCPVADPLVGDPEQVVVAILAAPTAEQLASPSSSSSACASRRPGCWR